MCSSKVTMSCRINRTQEKVRSPELVRRHKRTLTLDHVSKARYASVDVAHVIRKVQLNAVAGLTVGKHAALMTAAIAAATGAAAEVPKKGLKPEFQYLPGRGETDGASPERKGDHEGGQQKPKPD